MDPEGKSRELPRARRARARCSCARRGVVVRTTTPLEVLGANDTQASSLSLVFDFADKAGLPLVDLDDLRAVLQYLTGDAGKAELKEIGGISSATAGVLLRKIVELDQQGAEAFFGEPELDTADLMRTTTDGKGVISCLELAAVQDKPKLFSTFLDVRGATVTVCQDKAGADESIQVARDWVAANAADLGAPAPTITEGSVGMHLA